MATISEAQVLGGHTARIVVDGTDVGWMQGVSYNMDAGVQGVYVIGSVEPQEHQQTRFTISGEINRYYVRDTLIEDSKLGARTASEIIRTGTFDIVILDDITKSPIVILESCTLATKAASIQAGQLVTQRHTFQALRTK